MDIPILLRHFLSKHGRGRRVDVSRPARQLLEAFDFPRNVRQLENAVVEALARLGDGSLILPKHLPRELTSVKPAQIKDHGLAITIPSELSYEEARAHALREVDRICLSAILQKHGGNRRRAAKEAGVDPKTLAARLKASETTSRDSGDA